MAFINGRSGLQVKQKAASGYVLKSGEFAECDYVAPNGPVGSMGAPATAFQAFTTIYNPVTRRYGPGDTIPATIVIQTVNNQGTSSSAQPTSVSQVTMSFSGGVVFKGA
ncbi:MAG: hypothetical protein KF802_01200 [Bdellovibrionaceae bacterium]|nr:hypothetical protein [Pseudobdellovibrionaceae bacterium]